MKQKNKSFSKRLSLNLILDTSILLLAIIVVAAIVGSRLMRNEIQHSLETYRHATTVDIENTLQSVEHAVKAAAWVVHENRQDPNRGYHVTKLIVQTNKDIIGSTVAFARGFYEDKPCFSPYSCDVKGSLVQKDLAESYDYFITEWFKACYDSGEPRWSEPYFDEGGGDVLMATYSFPLKDESGKIFAVLTADILLDWLEEKIHATNTQNGSKVLIASAEGNLMNGDGSPIFNIEKDVFYAGKDDVKIPQSATKNMKEGKCGSFSYFRGKSWTLMAYGPLSNGGQVVILCNMFKVYKNLDKMILALLLTTLLGLPILFYLCYTVVRRHTRIIERFSSSAMSIAEGNFNTPLPEVKHQDEIKQLCDSFDHMQHSLHDYIDRLKTTTAEKQRYESELNIARNIQMQMLTKDAVKNDHCTVSAIMHPAREVGGDLYDYYVNDGYLYFCIGDVSGKGVPAALYMAITRAAFRYISSCEHSMDRVAENINNAVCNNNDNVMFVTMFMGRIDLRTGDFEYCNAGHNPSILIAPDGTAEYMKVEPNLACGLIEGFTYQMQRGKLTPGTKLLLYTDGVTEAEKVNKEQYGEERLLKWCLQTATGDCNLADALLQSVQNFAEGAEQSDDITILTVELLG